MISASRLMVAVLTLARARTAEASVTGAATTFRPGDSILLRRGTRCVASGLDGTGSVNHLAESPPDEPTDADQQNQ